MEIITQDLKPETNFFEIVGSDTEITIEADNVVKDDVEYKDNVVIYQFMRDEEIVASLLRREDESDTVMINNGLASITREFEGNKIKVEEFGDQLEEV